MLARDFSQKFESQAETVNDKYHSDRGSWVDFCLFPDIIDPVKMPSLFPIPSHVVRRQQVFTLTVPAGGNMYCLWKPLTVDTNNISDGYRPGFFYQTAIPVQNTDTTGTSVQGTSNPTYGPTLSSASGLVHGGARMIGAFVELEYVGTADQHSGLVEAGLHLHSVNSFNDVPYCHFYDQSEMVQAPFYRKFKPLDGIRCVWFPIDDQDFQFQDYDIGTTGIGEPPTAANVTIRSPVWVQWAINLTGLQAGQSVRVHMCSYYECIVDEQLRDIYMASRAKVVQDPQKAKLAVTEAVAAGAAATPSKSAGGFGQMFMAAKEFAANLNSVYGLMKENAGIINGIGQTIGGAVLGGIKGGPLGALGGGVYGAYNAITK